MRREIICLALVVLMSSLFLYIPTVSAQNGPEIDLLRYKVIKNLDSQREAMLTGIADSWIGLIRTSDLETLNSNGLTITSAPGFHMGFIGYNIRDAATLRSYYRPEITYWPLHDVEFRHAIFHCWDQLGIIPLHPTTGYIVTPINSLVPPAQNRYYNPNVPQHPYNPGNPFTSPAGEHSSVGLLKAKGYTFVDADSSGTVTNADYWKCPDGSPIPRIVIWTPAWPCGTTLPFISEFIQDLRAIGLAATSTNGLYGIMVMARDFLEYMNDVFGTSSLPGGRFDAFVAFYNLGKMPRHLYTLCHSSQDTHVWWGRGNAPGINDPVIDALVETVNFSLDLNAVAAAARQVQERLCDPTLPNADNYALSYMMLYSRTYFNAYNPSLIGIINSYGYGSKNIWTSLNLNWMPGFERIIDSKIATVSILDDQPQSFNPLYARVDYEWDILNQLYDGLININPYNHNDIPWLATDWTITSTPTGMEIGFTLRDDLVWQDGKPFTAYDAEFCLEFIKTHSVPRYYETCSTLEDVVVAGTNAFTIQCNQEGIELFYDFATLACMLPEHIWNRTWPSDEAVLDYDPTEPYNVAPGYTPGPNPPPTNLFGTGPWTFQFYNTEEMECDLYANRNHFITQAEVQTLLSNMFWEVGDYNRDAIVNIVDLAFVSFAFGSIIGDPEYDSSADFNSDGIIDTRDMRIAAFQLLSKKEHP